MGKRCNGTSGDFTVTVTDNGNGTLTAVTNYPEDKDKFEFVNRLRCFPRFGGVT